jgi:predicted RNA-binding Zn-ribbon protein involved in translation (DUF1610 family)
MKRPSEQRGDNPPNVQIESDGLDEWEPWYPCPECGSTTLEQTETFLVYASEDGSYGGDDADVHSHIECANCGEVLQA